LQDLAQLLGRIVAQGKPVERRHAAGPGDLAGRC